MAAAVPPVSATTATQDGSDSADSDEDADDEHKSTSVDQNGVSGNKSGTLIIRRNESCNSSETAGKSADSGLGFMPYNRSDASSGGSSGVSTGVGAVNSQSSTASNTAVLNEAQLRKVGGPGAPPQIVSSRIMINLKSMLFLR